MNKHPSCAFNPEARQHRARYGELLECPGCHHIVLIGLPHPDFDSPYLPISEKALAKMSESSVGLGIRGFGILGFEYDN